MSVYLGERKGIANTGVYVSPLGLGTVKFGRDKAVKYSTGFKIPDDKAALDLLNLTWDLGINLIDTAPAYGNSEKRLGQLLPKLNKDWIIATKVGESFNNQTGESSYNFTREFITTSIQKSLRNLNRDVLDIVMIHSDGNDFDIIQQGALAVLADLKQQGLIRAIGMSTKTVDGSLLALQQSDLAMVMYNLEYQDELPVIEQAQKDNKGIFIKKALDSGHLTKGDDNTDIVQANFDFIFQQTAVSSIIIGTITTSHLEDNVKKTVTSLKQQRLNAQISE